MAQVGETGEPGIRKEPCSQVSVSPARVEEENDSRLKRCRLENLMEDHVEGYEDVSHPESSNEVWMH